MLVIIKHVGPNIREREFKALGFGLPGLCFRFQGVRKGVSVSVWLDLALKQT